MNSSNIGADEMLYSEKDLEKSMDKIETINFHQVSHLCVSILYLPFSINPFQEVDVNGIKFWCYNAGHVLGAAMFMIEIAGVKIFYTGDFSCEEDRHLMAAEIPSVSPDVLISVSCQCSRGAIVISSTCCVGVNVWNTCS